MSKKWETVEYPSRPAMVEGLLSFREQGHLVQTIDGLRKIAVLQEHVASDDEVVEPTPVDSPSQGDGATVSDAPASEPVVPNEPAYSAPDDAAVRAWAKEQGIPVQGFISKAVVEQYKAAHAAEGEGLL